MICLLVIILYNFNNEPPLLELPCYNRTFAPPTPVVVSKRKADLLVFSVCVCVRVAQHDHCETFTIDPLKPFRTSCRSSPEECQGARPPLLAPKLNAWMLSQREGSNTEGRRNKVEERVCFFLCRVCCWSVSPGTSQEP